MALASDLQDQLDLLVEDFRKAAAEAEAHRDRRLLPFTDPAAYVKPDGPLEVELAVLRDRGAPPLRPRLLVTLCGLTAPPLLLTMRFLAPQRALLVCSKSEEGREGMRKVRAQVEPGRLHSRELEIADDAPEQAFEALYEGLKKVMAELQLGSDDVLIDITGGKKTMTAAAFLVASHLRVKTIYMDGKFAPGVGPAEPGTARLQVLTDPVTHFWLEERKAVRSFFERGDFRMAALLLRKMGREAEARRAEAAALWRDARYQEAERVLEGQQVPEVLRVLADRMPRLSAVWTKPRGKSAAALFTTAADQEGLLRFCVDRLHWGLRDFAEGKGDLRRGFLEAYSACEALLEERLTETEREAHAHLGKDRPLRLHRNALVHRIASPDPALINGFLAGQPSLAEQILTAAAGRLTALSSLDRVILDPLRDLELLRPADLDGLG